MLFRPIRFLLNSAIFIALSGCAPGEVPPADEDASYDEGGLEECPTSLETALGRNAYDVLLTGAHHENEAFVLEATEALAASDADRSCFARWTKLLWIVASNGFGATVLEPMISAGLDPNLTDIDTSPLCSGCTGSRYGMTTLHFATMDSTSHNGGTTLRTATSAERLEMVRILLEMGADPNLVCSGALYGGGNQVGAHAIGGATPLMLTASWDDQVAALEAARLLVDAGTDLNVRALSSVRSYLGSDEVKPGDTALSIARRSGNTALVELLLATGAIDWDLEAEERAAKSSNTEEIAEILATKTVDHNRIWSIWFNDVHKGPIATLLAAGLDPNALTWGGKYAPLWATVFQTAVYARLPPADLRALVEAGADLNEGGTLGMPPLVVLIDRYDHYGYREALTMLLEAGADIEGRAADGDTPLLRMMYVNRGLDTEELLLGAGADPNAANHLGQRPLSVAVRAKKPLMMVDRLIAQGADLNADVGDAPLWAYALEHNPIYVSDENAAQVAPVLDRFVNHPSLVIDLAAPGVRRALSRADTNPLVKPFADVIRARACASP